MKWVYEEYEKNLSEEALKDVPTETLQAIVDSCNRGRSPTPLGYAADSLCEVCAFYLYVIEKRKTTAKKVKK